MRSRKPGVIVKMRFWEILRAGRALCARRLATECEPYLARVLSRLLLAGLMLGFWFRSPALAQTPDLNGAVRLPEMATNTVAGATASENLTNGLCLNFHGAPVSLVLEYLSEAGGFVISQEAAARDPVDVWSNGPVTKDQAVDLLNASLKRQGCAVTRRGRILTLVDLDRARTSDLEIVIGNDSQAVVRSDEMVTQIIPVRYASVSQLVNNLQPLLPGSASVSVNESANTLILVATGTDVRRMLKIISALDNAIARVSSIKVFPLQYADAKGLASVVQQLFASEAAGQSSRGLSAGTQSFGPPGGGDMGPPGLPEPPGAATGSDGTDAAAAGTKVTAVADERANCLIVCASAGLLPAVAEVVQRLDRRVSDVAELRVFRLRNADASELAEQLAQLFPEDSSSRSGQGEAGFSFGEMPPPVGGPPDAAAAGLQSDSSQAHTKRGRVLAVADARTSSLVVSAASSLMPQIAALIERLDADSGRKEVVGFWDLHNADPQDVKQVLQCLFNRNISSQNDNNPLLGQNNPLTVRQTQQQTTTTSGTFQLENAGGSGPTGSGGGL
jgi:type II secretory pathway component GspD/PulD (secretin)